MRNLKIIIICSLSILAYAGTNNSKEGVIALRPPNDVTSTKEKLVSPLDVVTNINDIQNIIRAYVYEWRLGKSIDNCNCNVQTIAITPDGKKIVTGSRRKTIQIWDWIDDCELRLCKAINTKLPVTALAITYDNTKFVVGLRNGLVTIYDFNSCKIIGQLEDHTSFFWSILLTRDNKRIIVGSAAGCIRIWSLDTLQELNVLNEHNGAISALAITSDDTKIVSGSDDRTIKIWDLNADKSLHTITSGLVRALLITPDNAQVIACSCDHPIIIIDINTGSIERHIYTFNSEIRSLAISTDGKKLFLGCHDGRFAISDLLTIEQEKLVGHFDTINAVVMAPDGKKVISGCDEANILIWVNLAYQLEKKLPSIKTEIHSDTRCAQCKKKCYLTCARCKETYYCSGDCQKAHWKIHKSSCKSK